MRGRRQVRAAGEGRPLSPAPTCAPRPAPRASCSPLPGATAFHFPGPAVSGPDRLLPLPRAPLTPAPRARPGAQTAPGCSARATSSCAWVPTHACHALLGPAGRWALIGMVPSSQTPVPRDPQHHQALVPKENLTNASKMDKFGGGERGKFAPSEPCTEDGLSPPTTFCQVSESRTLACCKWSGHGCVRHLCQ